MWVGTNNGIYEYAPAGDTFIPHFATADSSKQIRCNQLTERCRIPGNYLDDYIRILNRIKAKDYGDITLLITRLKLIITYLMIRLSIGC